MQRLLLAREISSKPLVLVANHPTRGLDVQSTNGIRQLLLEQSNAGAAILLIADDLDEILALSDRIAVIYEGQLRGIFPRDEASIEEIGLLMAGSRLEVQTE